MKQVLQNLKTGITEVTDARCPRAGCGQLLISTSYTLVSAGTERMLVDFGKAGLIDKARQQPDKVRMVLDKIRTDGLMPTLHAVRNKLAQPLPMGYCNVGVVAEVGAGVTGFAGIGLERGRRQGRGGGQRAPEAFDHRIGQQATPRPPPGSYAAGRPACHWHVQRQPLQQWPPCPPLRQSASSTVWCPARL